MKKILFLPLLQMQSGHHQVADSLMDMFKKHADGIIAKKIDLLSYTNKPLEKVLSNGYLKWIRYAPRTYNFAYKSFFYVPQTKEPSFRWYEPIFLKKMEQLLAEENPDLIVCTHGFPSYVLSKLKMKKRCKVPIINVYTDFFINSIWGRDGIDIHFLPSKEVKEKLGREYHIPDQNMIVTGIPVHSEIIKNNHIKNHIDRQKILITGGNSGLGGILNLSDELKKTQLDYLVLCGNNQKLYDEIVSWNLDHIKALPYITSRSEMNKLYEEVDAIVTKPGGVTISEALRKRLPIFVHSMLPGQEKINQHYLKEQGLVFELDQKKPFEKQLLTILKDEKKMNRWEQAINLYQRGIEMEKPEIMVDLVKQVLNQKTKDMRLPVVKQPSQVLDVAARAYQI